MFLTHTFLELVCSSLQNAKEEKRLELQSGEEDQSTKKSRQNSRSERRRLQAQLRERAQIELEHVRTAREQLHNVDIFPYKAHEGDETPSSPNRGKEPRKLPLAGSTGVSTDCSASFLDGYGEFAEWSETHESPQPTNMQQKEPGLECASPLIFQEDAAPLVRQLAVPQQISPAIMSPEEGDFESGTATHVASEQAAPPPVHEAELSKSKMPLSVVRETSVIKAKTFAPLATEKDFAMLIEKLLAFRIISQGAAAALRASGTNVGGMEERSSGTAACTPCGKPGLPSATAVAKALSENILRCHPMCHTVRSILTSKSMADSSSSSSSEDDGTNLPAYRTLSVQRRSCMRRRSGPLRFFRRATSRVDWAANADEAIYIEYVAPVVSLLPPEPVEVHAPSLVEPSKQIKLASQEAAAARAAAAAKAAAEGDPEREAAAQAAAATAAALAKEAAQEAAEVAAAEARAIAKQEQNAVARLTAVAAILAEAEAKILAAKARAGRLSKEELEQWQGLLEGS